MRADPVARFWSKVDKSGGPDACWPWQGAKNGGGYGLASFAGRGFIASRLAVMLSQGVSELDPRRTANHHCDTPACCNPRHIYIGTHADNMADKAARGRVKRAGGLEPGEHASVAALALNQYVRAKHGRQAEIARKLGLHPAYLSVWRKGHARPGPALRDRLARITRGVVRADDWLRAA